MGITLPIIYIAASVVVVLWAFVTLVRENKKLYRKNE